MAITTPLYRPKKGTRGSMHYTVSPAYGRGYKYQKDFLAGKDFTMHPPPCLRDIPLGKVTVLRVTGVVHAPD